MVKLCAFAFFILGWCPLALAQINLEKIDSIVHNATVHDFYEGTVLVADQGEIIYHESFGFTDQESRVPLKNSTCFSIASITKMFTAIIILQMVEEGKIELNDKLNRLLPNLKIPKSNKITVHHLLLHISGLPNEDDEIYTQIKSPEAFVLETIKNKSKRIGKFNYANIDYVILGLIIEKYTGMSWENTVKNRILKKTDMEDTGFLKKDNYPSPFAYTSSFDQDNRKSSDPLFFIENFYAAGCMYSTASDLLKLDQAMYGDLLLSKKSKDIMFKSYPEYNYSGYSVWTYNYPFARSNPRVMERRGGILGANSVLLRMLDTNRTIVILSTNNKFNPDSFGNTQSLKESLMIEVSNINP